jgi:hypothetical protein
VSRSLDLNLDSLGEMAVAGGRESVKHPRTD